VIETFGPDRPHDSLVHGVGVSLQLHAMQPVRYGSVSFIRFTR
jgi:hypothetical protein